jgi:glycosyltransferase involved in cell wall biosynthesis
MRIAYFSESLPPVVDGVVRTLSRLFATLDQEGVDFRIVSPFAPGADWPFADRVWPVRSMKLSLYDYYRVGLPYFQGMERRLDAWAPDLVHLANPTPLNVFGADWARARGIPAVSSYHTHFVRYFRYYGFAGAETLGWGLLRWFHNRTAATFAPSPSTVRELGERGIANAELWSRGIDLTHFSPAKRDPALRRRAGAQGDEPLVLFVGRLVKEKDLADLADADALLRAQGRSYRLAVVGDGPMRPDLQLRMPHAHFAGTVTGEALHRWFASADIFAFPSTTETFGNVVLEAAASGIPAVVVAAGGVQDVVRHGVTGLIARPNDPGDFAAAIAYLLADRGFANALGRQALEQARSASWTDINRGLLRRYRDIARRPVLLPSAA